MGEKELRLHPWGMIVYAMPKTRPQKRPREERFERGLAALRWYVRRHGHARIPNGHREAGINLMRWVSVQRDAYRRGRLSRERVLRLEAVRGWSWSPRDQAWNDALAELRRYVRKHGHACVPVVRRRTGPYVFLALWVKRQRRMKKRGRLPPDRVRLLERLPGWSWGPGRLGSRRS